MGKVFGVDWSDTVWCNEVMDLRALKLSLNSVEWREFAIAIGTKVGHLNNMAYGINPISPLYAARIERQSCGRVRRWTCRPKDWHELWPELVGTADAPPIPCGQQPTEVRDAA